MPYSSQCLDSRANFPREMASCRELLFRELISISFGYMRFRFVALQLSLLKVDYTEIMKRVLKNREKSLRSEKMNAKGESQFDSVLGVVWFDQPSNVQLEENTSNETQPYFSSAYFFPLRSPGELYNQENVTVTPLELLGWRHVMLTYISGEGVTCVESTDFNEIWPENSLNIKNQRNPDTHLETDPC